MVELRKQHQSCSPAAGAFGSETRAMLALAEEAEQRLHEDQAALRGHLRLFATIDFGQSVVTRLIANFLQTNPGVTAELGYTNRPVHVIQEGYDAGVVAGDITDDTVVARPSGKIVRYLVASSAFLKSRSPPKKVSDLESWPWISLSARFGVGKDVTLYSAKRGEQTFRISPVLISEGVTSLREAVRAGLGIAIISEWVIREDLRSGRLVRVLPQWDAKEFPAHVVYPGHRALPARVRAFIDFAVKYMSTELHPRV